jgi:hypothetical protein
VRTVADARRVAKSNTRTRVGLPVASLEGS